MKDIDKMKCINDEKGFCKKAGISNASIAKLGRNENVNILLKICVALECKIDDILEIIVDK